MDFDLRPFALFSLTDAQKLALVDALLKDAEWRAFISKTNAKGQGEDHPRVLTEAHFAKITTQLDDLEQQAKDSLRATLTAIREALLKQVRKEFGSDPKWINALGLPKRKELTQGVRNMLRGAFEQGSGHARYEITGHAEYDVNRLGMKPKAALRYLDQKAFWITGVLSDDLLRKSKAILYQALKNGEPLEGTVIKLRDAFIPYLGDERAIEDDEQLQPYRLETIVRTNTTAAYNEGRLTEMRDPALQEYLAGIEYSAIIDQRTTEVCQHLDGKVFRPDDPDIEKFTPPNHFNCRSLLVPVLIYEPPDIGDFITPSDKGRAEELMDEGFGGSSKF